MKLKELIDHFHTIYGESQNDLFAYFAPGRINLIGEHTDYNGGLVLPCGLDFGTYLLIRKNNNDYLSCTSLNFEGTAKVPLNNLEKRPQGDWVNFPIGIFDQFREKNITVGGMDLLYYGNIPNGAGLSSSASIEVVTAFAVNSIWKAGFNLTELAFLAQRCEHNFIGTQCGIMDQYAVTFAQKNKAVFLNCTTLKFTMIPFETGEYKIVIANTNKRRELNESKYNERVTECNTALKSISRFHKLNNLGELSLEVFRQVEHYIQHPVRKQRVYHVVNENYRVLESVKALENHDLKKFGKLMNASHNSLSDYYEVTGFELDTMVTEARKLDGVLGERMTGAGFGGCAICLVHQDKTSDFIEKLGYTYQKVTKLKPSFYIAETGNGVREIIL